MTARGSQMEQEDRKPGDRWGRTDILSGEFSEERVQPFGRLLVDVFDQEEQVLAPICL